MRILDLTSHLPHLRFFDLSEDEGKEVFGWGRLDTKDKRGFE